MKDDGIYTCFSNNWFKTKLVMMAHGEVEAGWWNGGQPGLHSQTQFQKKKERERERERKPTLNYCHLLEVMTPLD